MAANIQAASQALPSAGRPSDNALAGLSEPDEADDGQVSSNSTP